MAKSKTLVPVEDITRSILVLHGHKVLLDEDLAALYGVVTGALIQAVKRNIARFPMDFVFQLTARVDRFEITNCDIKAESRWATLCALCVHRARRRHALLCSR
jgi:hypothetical protein